MPTLSKEYRQPLLPTTIIFKKADFKCGTCCWPRDYEDEYYNMQDMCGNKESTEYLKDIWFSQPCCPKYAIYVHLRHPSIKRDLNPGRYE